MNGCGVRIVTWNVNSLRARESQVFDWIEAHRPDVVCLQETKVTDQEFPEDAFGDLHYDVAYHGQRTYNGVAIASPAELTNIQKGFHGEGAESEKRFIAATILGVRVICVYVPNGQSVGSEKYAYKLAWMAEMKNHLMRSESPDRPLVLCGDFNVAPTDIDVHDPARWDGGVMVSEPEREHMRVWIDWGLIDAYRHVDRSPGRYTWWDYRTDGFKKKQGLRIDHVLVTRPLVPRVVRVEIDLAARAAEQPSDHAPVILEIAEDHEIENRRET